MSRAAAFAASLAAAVLVAACGLDVAGQAQASDDGRASPIDASGAEAAAGDASGSGDGSRVDASADASADVITVIDSGGETDCLDGIDNDGNGLADCADPKCNALVTCVPVAAPGGWVGYALVRDNGGAPCPSSYAQTTDAFSGLNAPLASCSACSCTASGATCPTTANLTCSGNTACTIAPQVSATLSSAACEPQTFTLDKNDYCALAAIAPTSAGQCASSQVVATKPPVTWKSQPRICGAPKVGAGCAAGSQCIGRGPTGFSGICVAQSLAAGAPPAACPSGFAAKTVVTSPSASSYNDTRGCTSCACAAGTPTGAACAVTSVLYTSGDCGAGAEAPLPGDGACHTNLVPNDGTRIGSAKTTITTTQGTCGAASGGQPTGAAQANTQTQYCCR